MRDAQGRVRPRVRNCGGRNGECHGRRRHGRLFKKADRKKRKEGTFRKKVHKFLFNLSLFSKIEMFFSQNLRQFETKDLLLRLIKHNFPFIPPHCGVYIAQSRGTFPDPPAQTLFDLLKHRDFALSLPIETCSRDAVPPNRGNVRNTHVLGQYLDRSTQRTKSKPGKTYPNAQRTNQKFQLTGFNTLLTGINTQRTGFTPVKPVRC